MFNLNKVYLLRPLTMKHTPFAVAAPDTTGSLKVADKAPPQKKFTYKDHKGRPLSLQKKKYTWTDATKRDKDNKPEGAVIEAVLKAENVGVYNFEEYERNEFERIAVAEGWPVEQILQMLQAAPEILETEIKAQKKANEAISKKQVDIDTKLNVVITNYGTLFDTYENVRMEISSMAAELPALNDSPYKKDYFTDMIPVVSNMAKTNFPELVKEATTPVPELKPTAEAKG